DTSTSLARTLGLEADAASRFFKTAMQEGDQGFLVGYAGHVDVMQVPIEEADRLATKAQSIRRNARVFDNQMPGQRAPQTSPLPFPFPLPAPPAPTSTGPDAASLRRARLYDAVQLSVDRFLAREV